jgi:hypothetical protein
VFGDINHLTPLNQLTKRKISTQNSSYIKSNCTIDQSILARYGANIQRPYLVASHLKEWSLNFSKNRKGSLDSLSELFICSYFIKQCTDLSITMFLVSWGPTDFRYDQIQFFFFFVFFILQVAYRRSGCQKSW